MGTDWPPIEARVKEIVVYDCGEKCGIDHTTMSGAQRCQINGFHRRVFYAQKCHEESLREFVESKLEQGIAQSKIAKMIGKSPQWVGKNFSILFSHRRQQLSPAEARVLVGIAQSIASDGRA